jgi:hypothetical protein
MNTRAFCSAVAVMVICPNFSLSIPCVLQSSTAMFIPWLVSTFCLLIFTIMPVALIRSAPSSCRRKGRSRQLSSTSNSSSATANSAERSDGVKRRREGLGSAESASSPSVASAQGRLRQRPEMVSSLIYFFSAPPARFRGSAARASGLLHSHTLYSSC